MGDTMTKTTSGGSSNTERNIEEINNSDDDPPPLHSVTTMNGGSSSSSSSSRSPGILLGLRVLKEFPHNEEQQQSALFLGTVIDYEACYSVGAQKNAKKKKKKRKTSLGKGLYRVQFDDGDVDDMTPDEVYQCALLYHEERQLCLKSQETKKSQQSSVKKKSKGRSNKTKTSSSLRFIIGAPTTATTKKTTPKNNNKQGRRQQKISNSSSSSLISSSEDAGIQSILSHINKSLSQSDIQALESERMDYWVEYNNYNLKHNIRPPESIFNDFGSWWDTTNASLGNVTKEDEIIIRTPKNKSTKREEENIEEPQIKMIIPKPLTIEGFEKFGDVIEVNDDTCQHYTINDGNTERYHDLAKVDVSTNGGYPMISIFRAKPIVDKSSNTIPLRMMERHPLGSQAFIPKSNYPYLVVVAPPTPDGDHPNVNDIEVFVATKDQGVNYNIGVWHHYCLALNDISDFIVIDRGGSGNNCDVVTLDGSLVIDTTNTS